jgi:quinol-cytochrome oxidoreductase complex cytochrome b subunit
LLHEHGSSNPNGHSGNSDRLAMHPYFTFKDLVTIFLFFLALSIIVCYYPNLLGQMWPNIIVLIVYLIYVCAISWKYTLNKNLVKIYNKTILVSDLLIDKNLVFLVRMLSHFLNFLQKIKINIYLDYLIEFVSINYFSFLFLYLIKVKKKIIVQVFIYLNPYIVRSYYKVYNQQITKVINLRILKCLLNIDLKKIITLVLFDRENCTYYNEFKYNQLSQSNI